MFTLHDVAQGDCDMVAVKSEDCAMTDSYRNWAGVACTETFSAQSQVINVKEECAKDCVWVKDECNVGHASDFVSLCGGQFDLKSEDIVELQNVYGKYQIDDENVGDVQNCGLPEECAYPNVGIPVDKSASAISREQTQTIKVKMEESTTHISVDASDVSDCSGAHNLKPEEVDLGCELDENSQSSCSADDDSSDENFEKAHSPTLRCPFCDMEYSDQSTLRKHLLTHTGDHPYPCTRCEQKFAQKSQLKRHMAIHPVAKPNECKYCQKIFDKESDLNHHMLTHEKPFVCNVCNRKFTTNTTLTIHMKSHIEKSYMCEYCEKNFTTKSALRKHRVRHTGEKRYECDVCGSKFGHWGSLRNHMFKHTGDRPHACHICNRKFCWKQALAKHIMIHDARKKSYTCNYCEQEFTDTPLFIEHMIAHTGGRPYKCKVCEKEFKRTVAFNEHILQHTGIRPYACNVCPKTYSLKKHLTEHLKVHSVDEKNYTCKLCGKISTYTIGQTYSEEKGSSRPVCECLLTDNGDRPHACRICKRTFTLKSTLQRHMLTHTGEKPHVCTVCDNKYADKSGLSKHLVSHTGTKPHKCDLCEKRYARRDSLKKHMLKQHEELQKPE